jgi:hypothetical protein
VDTIDGLGACILISFSGPLRHFEQLRWKSIDKGIFESQ